MNSGITRWKIVPSYRGLLRTVAPLMGFFHSFVPVASPMKFATPIGALSGKSVQVILPTVVSMMATGFGPAGAAGFAGADWPTMPVCAVAEIANAKRTSTVRMNTPQFDVELLGMQRCIVRQSSLLLLRAM